MSGNGKPVVVLAPEIREPELMYKLFDMRIDSAGFTPVCESVEEMLGHLAIIDWPTPDTAEQSAGQPAAIRATIQRLFRENPSPLPAQAPAIECGVMLRGVPVTLMGSLSETPEGGLRLLSPDPSQERPIRPGTPMKMVEQFFDYEDVMVVAVRRQVTMDAPRIIQS
jgi:hypothetical protein